MHDSLLSRPDLVVFPGRDGWCTWDSLLYVSLVILLQQLSYPY